MNDLGKKIFAAAHAVHTYLGPGLFEIVYESCLFAELRFHNLAVERQKKLPLRFRDASLDCCYRLDLVVEVKAVEQIIPIPWLKCKLILSCQGSTRGGSLILIR